MDARHGHRHEKERQQMEKDRNYTFALVPKMIRTFFFDVVMDGCAARAIEAGNVICKYVGPDWPDASGQVQADIISNLTESGGVDGMAISVINADAVADPIAKAVEAGISVITFDSDAPASKRSAYVGTNNTAFGLELGKVLKQLRPTGGKFALLSGPEPNLLEREKGFRRYMEKSIWKSRWNEVDDGSSPADYEGNTTVAMDAMIKLAKNPDISAIIPVTGRPMFDPRWKEFVDVYRGRISLIVADAAPHQIDLLSKGYADGLVSQLPYQMGQQIVDVLLDMRRGGQIGGTIFGTEMLQMLRVPLILPEGSFDYNYIGSLRILGYTLFGVVVSLSIGFAVWTFLQRETRVVMSSQPEFLYLICFGILVFGSAIIPMGIDDEYHSSKGCDIACMCVPWLVSMGFTLIFSALFSKTWRINKLFHNPNRFQRVKVTPRDVILPLVVLMTANTIVLACWTALAPLQFVREDDSGTDLWNRPISSSGRCRSTSDRKGGSAPYAVLIALFNMSALVIANVQAYRARDIKTEFSESKYIGLVMASMLQAFVIAAPILGLVRDDPTVFYVTKTLLVFVLSVVILLLIFVPKVVHLRKWKAEKKAKKKKATENETSSHKDETRSRVSEHTNTTQIGGGTGNQPGGAKRVPFKDEVAENCVQQTSCQSSD